jgi:ABC-type phosphate/phosphonate transport system substrate-binding protein
MSFVELNMYLLPALKPAIEDLWCGLAKAFRGEGLDNVPDVLSWEGPNEARWCDNELFLAQTCGYPLTHALAGRVELLAVPCYSALELPPTQYCSLVLVAEDSPAATLEDLRRSRVAYNSDESQSGFSTLRHLIAPLSEGGRFFQTAIKSGSHFRSIEMVAAGEADCCAVDGVTYHLAARHAPEKTKGVRVLARTADAPNLPYITASGRSVEELTRMRAALTKAMEDPATAVARDALFLTGVEFLPLQTYDRILEMEREALDLGYRHLG